MQHKDGNAHAEDDITDDDNVDANNDFIANFIELKLMTLRSSMMVMEKNNDGNNDDDKNDFGNGIDGTCANGINVDDDNAGIIILPTIMMLIITMWIMILLMVIMITTCMVMVVILLMVIMLMMAMKQLAALRQPFRRFLGQTEVRSVAHACGSLSFRLQANTMWWFCGFALARHLSLLFLFRFRFGFLTRPREYDLSE